MTVIRATTATIFFILAVLFTIKLFTESFMWISLIIAAVCFALAYVIWPSKKHGQRHEENWLFDVMEIVIEFPVDIIFWIFRMLGHLFRKGDGIDIDL